MRISKFVNELMSFTSTEQKTKKYRTNTIITLVFLIIYYLIYINQGIFNETLYISLPYFFIICIWNLFKWVTQGLQYIKADIKCTKLAEELIPECIEDIMDVIPLLSHEDQREFFNSLQSIQNDLDSVVYKLGALLPLRVSVHLHNIGVTEFPCDDKTIKIAASKSFDRLSEQRDAATAEKIRSINSSLLALEKLIPACYKLIQLEI